MAFRIKALLFAALVVLCFCSGELNAFRVHRSPYAALERLERQTADASHHHHVYTRNPFGNPIGLMAQRHIDTMKSLDPLFTSFSHSYPPSLVTKRQEALHAERQREIAVLSAQHRERLQRQRERMAEREVALHQRWAALEERQRLLRERQRLLREMYLVDRLRLGGRLAPSEIVHEALVAENPIETPTPTPTPTRTDRGPGGAPLTRLLRVAPPEAPVPLPPSPTPTSSVPGGEAQGAAETDSPSMSDGDVGGQVASEPAPSQEDALILDLLSEEYA
ncbi:hypothetical protein KIPB_001075 [Kipferlia bialata]|uniref:Uncharacterized protein n=1 Tax=Kipferlia bialata TaxID=797122 RepID=A0A9K3CQ34_9EUKA|nr:hypothetical protein KIPB_001075 [Kipferlia bialata]|eukprot:g1075.t1